MQLSNSVCYLIKTRRNKINCSFNKRMKTKQKSILYNTGTSFFVCLVAMEISYYLHTWITKLEVRHLQHCSSPDGKFTAAMRSEQKLSSQGDLALLVLRQLFNGYSAYSLATQIFQKAFVLKLNTHVRAGLEKE